MRYLILIMLAMSLGITACSKKSSSTAIPPATTTDDDDNNTTSGCTSNCSVYTIPGIPAPVNGQYYVGGVSNINVANYTKFIKAGLGVYADGGQFGDGGGYDWNYTCRIDIFASQIINCQSQQQLFNQYISDMANSPAIITLTFFSDGHVEGNWLIDAYLMFDGSINYYMGIPFTGSLVKMTDGRYVIQAGPLSIVTTSPTAKTTFNTYFFDGYNDLPFGSVSIR